MVVVVLYLSTIHKHSTSSNALSTVNVSESIPKTKRDRVLCLRHAQRCKRAEGIWEESWGWGERKEESKREGGIDFSWPLCWLRSSRNHFRDLFLTRPKRSLRMGSDIAHKDKCMSHCMCTNWDSVKSFSCTASHARNRSCHLFCFYKANL